MKLIVQFFLALAALVPFQSHLFSGTMAVELISQAEADVIIEGRMATKADEGETMRQKINGATVLQENAVKNGSYDIIVRRVVAPFVENPKSEKDQRSAESASQVSHSDLEFPIDTRKHESISVSATIFDEQYSKVVWRDTKTGRTYDLWTNINMVYLNPLSAFDTEGTHYNYFAMAEKITKRREQKRRMTAVKMGYDYESRWQESPVKLSDETFEYVVVTETNGAVPEKLYEQMDALFAFYLEKRESLEISYKNSEKLRISHEKFMQENPPELKPIITNFWPGKNSSYQSEQP